MSLPAQADSKGQNMAEHEPARYMPCQAGKLSIHSKTLHALEPWMRVKIALHMREVFGCACNSVASGQASTNEKKTNEYLMWAMKLARPNA